MYYAKYVAMTKPNPPKGGDGKQVNWAAPPSLLRANDKKVLSTARDFECPT